MWGWYVLEPSRMHLSRGYWGGENVEHPPTEQDVEQGGMQEPRPLFPACLLPHWDLEQLHVTSFLAKQN